MRNDAQRLADVLAAAEAIADHLERGSLIDGLVFDAVRVRLIEVGEAVKAIDPAVLAEEHDVPWQDIAGMRNHLAHRYFDTNHANGGCAQISASRRSRSAHRLHHLLHEPQHRFCGLRVAEVQHEMAHAETHQMLETFPKLG